MSEIATWPGGGLAFQIDYSREVLENVRRIAMQGLMDLPRIGLGVGGILLGECEDRLITILDSFELPCTHAFGPSFSLTPEEVAKARDLMANAGALRVIGWYNCKGLRPLELTDSDRTVLAALFPEPSHTWDIGLLVQPHMVRPARIVFLSPGSSGEVLQGESGELAEWREEPGVSTPAPPPVLPVVESAPVTEPPRVEPEMAEPAMVEPGKAPPVNPEWITRMAESRDPLAHDPVVTIRARNGSRWVRHGDPFTELVADAAKRQSSRRKRLTWILAAGTVIAAGFAGLALSRFWTPPPPPPPLVLQSSDAGGALVFRWNQDAVKGLDHAEIFITDGDRGRAVPLNRSQLSAGELRYVRKSPRVTAAMTAGSQQAETSFTAPAPRRRKSSGTPTSP